MMLTDDQVKEFSALFTGLTRAHGVYRITGLSQVKGKMEGKAQTLIEEVTIDLYKQHLEGKQGLGITPINDDAMCHFGAIDIDIYDISHKELEEKVVDYRLPLIPCKTKSGGCHLYLFCKEPIPASLIRSKLMEFAAALGYPGVEIFPKQSALASDKDVGSWINIPYFDHSKTPRHALLNNKPLTLEQFLQYANGMKVSEDELKAIIPPEMEELNDAPPCLQQLARAGIPDGTRNVVMFNFGVYCKLKFGDDWTDELDEINRSYCKPPLSSQEMSVSVIKSLQRKEYFYTCDKSPLCTVCNKELCRDREYGIGGGDDGPPVIFGTLSKLCTDPPTWFLDVDGVRLEFETEELINQDRFRKVCVEKLCKLPRKVKGMKWEKLIQDLLNKVEVIDAPEDSGPFGQFMRHVEDFCVGRAAAMNRDEILMGKPWTDEVENITFFRSTDLLRYLDQNKFKAYSPSEMWTALTKIGGFSKQFTIKGKTVRVWGVSAFERQSEEFDLPNIEGVTF